MRLRVAVEDKAVPVQDPTEPKHGLQFLGKSENE